MNKWEEFFGIKFPECKKTGQCCRIVTPSVPASELLKKAAEGDDYARDFFNIFIPYDSLSEALKVNEKTVLRSFKAAEEQGLKKEDIIFYYCRFTGNDNGCPIHEDRPQLCRDYPDTPFLVFSESCVYNEWSKICRKKYAELKEEEKTLKEQRELVRTAKAQQLSSDKYNNLNSLSSAQAKSIYLMGKFALVSPRCSWLKKY